jgi:KDO2-lipid IV(A) lauroyltransferase
MIRQLYRAGWSVGARLPRAAVDALLSVATRRTFHRNGRHVRTLRRNLSAVTGAAASDALVRAALRSHFRNVYEQVALPGWPADRVVDQVSTTGEAELRQAYASSGIVVALPHSGNWDLAGAWACRTGLPVTTVAERLGDAEFAAFTAFRVGLGMEVLSSSDRDAIPKLVDAVHRGRVVCLLADRDLRRAGVPVRWGSRATTMPVGPALVAQRASAALHPAVSQFTPDGMVLRIGAGVPAVPGLTGLVEMTQGVADFFAARIAEQPQDWHMLQPFFADEATADAPPDVEPEAAP